MRSYEAARSYFSFLSFLSWCVIVVGGIVAIAAMGAISEMNRRYYGGASVSSLAGLLPGAGIMFLGFIGLVLTQVGRATVDNAEYSQQMLQVARDQLDVSKQALKGGGPAPATFASKKEVPWPPPSKPKAEDPRVEPVASKPEPSPVPQEAAKPKFEAVNELEFQGVRIEIAHGKYVANGIPFSSRQQAEKYIAEYVTKASDDPVSPPKPPKP